MGSGGQVVGLQGPRGSQARFLKSSIAATVVGGPKTFGRTKKLSSRRSLGDQTTLGTNKIQKAERGQKTRYSVELDKNFDLTHLKYQNNLVIRPQKGKLMC